MKIFLGADHNGFHLKEKLEKYLVDNGYDIDDKGDKKLDPDDDFPIFASRVVNAMKSSEDLEPRGILICGSGQGMAIAANRYKGIRAIIVDNEAEAKLARNDDDSNVLALPGYVLDKNPKLAFSIVDTWLNTPFEKIERRTRRIKQLDEI